MGTITERLYWGSSKGMKSLGLLLTNLCAVFDRFHLSLIIFELFSEKKTEKETTFPHILLLVNRISYLEKYIYNNCFIKIERARNANFFRY